MTSIGDWVLVRRLPSTRRVLHEAIRSRAPWTRAVLRIERSEDGRRELRAIADAARRLDHPGIAGLVDDQSDAAEPAIALAWCDGLRLDAAIADLSPGRRLDAAIQIADLVAHAHDRGVVLRDVRPDNLRIAPPGAAGDGAAVRVTLVDVELARHGRPEPGAPGRPAGTWRWTAPEQAVLDASQVDMRADVWALGTTLYFVFAAEPVFSDGPAAIAEQLAGRRAAERLAALPEPIAAIIGACLALDRRSRPPAAAVADRLRALRGDADAIAWLAASPPPPEGDDPATAALVALAASLDGGGCAAAEAHLQIHDPERAAALAGELLARDPGDVRALACLARAHIERGAGAATLAALDRLDALEAGDALDEAARGRAIEAEVLALRPERALAWAHRAPPAERAAALHRVADATRDWLREHDRLDGDTRLVWETTSPRAGARHAIRRVAGAAQILAGKRSAPDATATVEELRAALVEDRVACDVPLDDLAERGAGAQALCEALLLHHVDLDDAAAAVALDDPLDAARVALVGSRAADALALLERAPPASPLVAPLRALALLAAGQPERAVELAAAAHAAEATPRTARWLCHVLLGAGRGAQALATLDVAFAGAPRAAWIDRLRIAARVAAGKLDDAVAACNAAGTADAALALGRALDDELDRRGAPAAPGWRDVALVRALVRADRAAGRFALVRAVHDAVGSLETLDLVVAACRARRSPDAARDALAACRAAFDAHPCADHALRLIGALRATGGGEEAEQLLATWLGRAANHAGLWCAAAHARLEVRDWNQALAAAERARALEPHNRDAAGCAMVARLGRGEPDRALAAARESTVVWPQGELAWDVRLEAEQALGARDPATAIADARDALRACPRSPRILRRLAGALAAADQIDDALAAHADALAAGPRDRITWADRARLLLHAGRAIDALQVAAALERLAGPVPEVGAIRMWAWLSLGEPALAIDAGIAVVAADRAGPSLWEGLTLAWLAGGSIADARNAFAMMQRTGGRPDRSARLALYLALADDATGALRELADAAIALAPRDPDLGFATATARLALGDADAAARGFGALLAAAPPWVPGLDVTIALARTGAQRTAAIDRAIDNGLAASPRALGWAGAVRLIARGRPAEATVLVRRAAAAGGASAALRALEVEACLRTGDAAGLRAAAARITALDGEARAFAAQLARRLGDPRASVRNVLDLQ